MKRNLISREGLICRHSEGVPEFFPLRLRFLVCKAGAKQPPLSKAGQRGGWTRASSCDPQCFMHMPTVVRKCLWGREGGDILPYEQSALWLALQVLLDDLACDCRQGTLPIAVGRW